MKPFNPLAYGPVFGELLQPARIMPLGPGRPNQSALPMLDQLDRAFDLFAIRDEDMADCCRAAAWLLHDFHDECHKICQDIATPSGSYWHAILHRREPDYGNSKYWFRRVGSHPVLAQLAAEQGGSWDPMAFVDQCERAARDQQLAEQCRRVQQREWELLFEYCFDLAAAPA